MNGGIDPKSALFALGARIRKARLERGMTQEVLAGPEFTKGYVSALERGAVRPSLKALDVFARRLNIPIADFLVARLDTDTPPELDALQEDLTYQFNYAKMLIRSGEVDEALKLLSEAEANAQPFLQKLPVRLRYQIPYLRGMARLQRAESDMARPDLEKALIIVEQDGDKEAIARVRNLLGVAYSQQNQPQIALEQHQQALRAVKNKEVQDVSLRLSIYRNMASDYWATGDVPHATDMYQEALGTLDGMSDLPHQAEIFWQLAMAFRNKRDWARAKQYATRALHIYEAADNSTEAAAISMNLAELLTGERKLGEAEGLLKKAEGLLASTGDPSLKSSLYHSYAELARERGSLDEASQYADMSIKLSDQLVREASKGSKQARSAAQRTHAQALHEAAMIEEKRHNTAEADRLFLEALKAIQQTGFDEVAYGINFSYAQILEARDDHKQAMEYYRKAAESHPRPARAAN